MKYGFYLYAAFIFSFLVFIIYFMHALFQNKKVIQTLIEKISREKDEYKSN